MESTILKIKKIMESNRSKCLFDMGVICKGIDNIEYALVYFCNHAGQTDRILISDDTIVFTDNRQLSMKTLKKRIYRPKKIRSIDSRAILKLIKRHRVNNKYGTERIIE